MRICDIGDTIRLEGSFEDEDEESADPTTTTLIIKVPPPESGAETSYVYGVDVNVIKDSTGEFYYDYYITNAPGEYTYRWFGVGAVAQAGERKFKVRETAFDSPI